MADVTAIAADLRKRVDDRLRAAAALLQAEHKRDLSTTFPPASKPGQYPAARTLNLRDAVAVEKIPGGYRVGYLPSASYILPLVKKGRKYLADTAARIGDRLRKIVRGA